MLKCDRHLAAVASKERERCREPTPGLSPITPIRDGFDPKLLDVRIKPPRKGVSGASR
jgi:hypothetical protein